MNRLYTNNLNTVTITKKVEKYLRTESGKSWKSKPESVETEVVSAEHYINYVESVPFFNNFGYGASCRAYNGYTCAGYIPVKITSISPMRETKLVATFTFS